jgi:hypothetical protein
MAARDILTLNTSMASRLIRCLYVIALILIAVMVILGLVRGVRVMTFSPPPRPVVSSAQQPPAADTAQTAPRPAIAGQRFARERFPGRRFGRPRGPFGMGFLPRSPVLAGLIIIIGTLLRGAIVLLVVRILAEIGLAILAMPRRSEA